MWHGLLRILVKTIKFVYPPLMCLCIVVCGLFIYARVNHVLPYKESNIEFVEYDNYRPPYVTQDYIKQEVDKLFPSCKYVLRFKDLEDGTAGCTLIMLNIVYIDKGLSLEQFALTLTHELVHLNYFTANERFTSFKEFQILYESGNEYFRNIALAYANLQVKGCYSYEYNCGGHIENYLNAKKFDN